MQDTLSRFVFEHAAIRGGIVSLDASCRDILGCHPYPPPLRRVLAELLAASALLASTLKFDGSLTVQLQGHGPLRLLVVECNAGLTMRATAQWSPAAESLPADATLARLAGGAGNARLAILLDARDGGPVYQGIVELRAASVAGLIEHYLAASEQIDSRILVAAEGERVRGFLLQRMPDGGRYDEKAWQSAAMRVDGIAAADLLDARDPESLLRSLYPDDDLRLFAPQGAHFACSCSAERVAGALRLVGRDEVESILDEQGSVTIDCEFCNRRYAFDAPLARALFEADPGSGPQGTRH